MSMLCPPTRSARTAGPSTRKDSRNLQERLRKAIRDNNFFLVRRLVSRPEVDIRNPDVDEDDSGDGYTSLAWSALCGHAEIFEYLMNCGHDDLELSKDEGNNTILILLASLRKGLPNPYNGDLVLNDVHQASMRMARAYHERYPMLLDWANEQGKTALHVSASSGNEDFSRLLCDLGADFDLPDMLGNTPLHYASSWGHSAVAQLLINRGCQYLARNNQGFTAADFAFSQTTKDELELFIRSLIESNKKLRRARSAAAREDWNRFSIDSSVSAGSVELNGFANGRNRVRSLSNASGTTSSGDTDYGGPVPSPDGRSLRPQASQGSVTSNPQQYPEPGTTSTPSFSSSNSSKSPSVTQTRSLSYTSPATSPPDRTSFQMETPRPPAAPFPSNTTPRAGSIASISPVAHRIHERDQGAIAQYQEYLNRKRTGSGNTVKDGQPPNPMPPLPRPKSAKPRLRTSASAAVLLSPTSSSSSSASGVDPRLTPRTRADTFDPHATPRHRAETLGVIPTAKSSSPTPTSASGGTEGTLRRVVSPALSTRAPPRSKEVTPWEFGSSDEDIVPSPPLVRRTESS